MRLPVLMACRHAAAAFPMVFALITLNAWSGSVWAGAGKATPVPPHSYDIPVPSEGAYTGAYCPDSISHQVTEKSLVEFEQATGKKNMFVHVFVDWLEDNALGQSSFIPFPKQACEMIYAHGAIPLITWQANIEARHQEYGFMLDRIANGEFDDHLKTWTKKIKQFPGTIFIRWGHEMNGDWFPWSGAQNGSEKPVVGEPAGPLGPARYRTAWNHIWELFQRENVNNVRWVWSVFPANSLGHVWNDEDTYWPGDDYVDWIGVSVINWSKANRKSGKGWKNFSDIVEGAYQKLTAKHPTKPLMLAEFACANPVDLQEGNKAKWIKEALKIIPSKYPQIKALCWYNDTVEAHPGFYPANFRLDFSPYRKAYSEGIAPAYFKDKISKNASSK